MGYVNYEQDEYYEEIERENEIDNYVESDYELLLESEDYKDMIRNENLDCGSSKSNCIDLTELELENLEY